MGAKEVLRSAKAEDDFYSSRVWFEERVGSCRSLNAVAAAAGVRMFESLVEGRLGGSTWLQLHYDAAGVLTTTYPDADAGQKECNLCGRFTGRGDEGLSHAVEILADGPES